MKIARSVSELVGKTPLVELGRIGKGLDARLVGKLEYFNPCGSVKDRIGLSMIESAEKKGKLKKARKKAKKKPLNRMKSPAGKR